MPIRNHHYQQMENRIREEIDDRSSHSMTIAPELKHVIDGIPNLVDRLRQTYENDRNPVHVWHAIMQLYFYARETGEPLAFPSWVLAYLVRGAQGIMGTAVNRPELQQAGAHAGKQASGSTVPPERNADGGMNRYSDWFAGARAKDRLRIANEALGFVGGRGSANAFVRAHRLDKDQELLRVSEALKRQGMTDEEVVGQLNDPRLKHTKDKIRRLRRVRKKARQ